jgi:hypothetical protein
MYASVKPLAGFLLMGLLLTWMRSSSSSSLLGKGGKSSKRLPNPHPGISHALVIASTTSSNLSWLDPVLEKTHWTPYIYVANASSSESSSPSSSTSSLIAKTNVNTNTKYQTTTLTHNKGNEALPYLTHIITHYHSLPDVTFFHHHHNQAWHQIYTSSYELERLEMNLDTVVKKGYVNTRCLPGCENLMELAADVVPLGDGDGVLAKGQGQGAGGREAVIGNVLHAFLGREVPAKIAGPCCAQFAVSREKILAVDLGTWKALRE